MKIRNSFGEKMIIFVLISLMVIKINCQTITMLTPLVLVRQGETAVLIAKSSTVIPSSQINWYYKGNALTINGQVTQQIGKYAVSSNGTVFTMSIQNVKSADYGFYSLLYVNLQTIEVTVINATVSELADTVVLSQCKNPKSTVAICVILVLSYAALFLAGSIFFLLIRSENNGKKIEIVSISVLLLTFQIGTAFMSSMVTLWAAFYKDVDNRNTTASILGFIAHLISWFPIYFFFANHAKQNKFQILYGYGLIILITIQIAVLIGVIICVSYCTNNISLPPIDVDYGMLGVLFSVISLIISCLILLFGFCYYKSGVFKQLIMTILQKENQQKSVDEIHDINPPSTSTELMRHDSPVIINENKGITEVIKEKPTKKKSLKSKLKNKLKSLKQNKIQNENGKQIKGSKGKLNEETIMQTLSKSPQPLVAPSTTPAPAQTNFKSNDDIKTPALSNTQIQEIVNSVLD